MRKRRPSPRRLIGTGLVGTVSIGLLSTLALPPSPRLVWNASASAPLGLYRVTPGATPDVDEMVVAWTPLAYRRFAAVRHYIPRNVPLVKRVAAIEHDIVCASDAEISINGRWVADRQRVDGTGRPLPWWSGCRVLDEGELFLLMDENPKAFDGRYFGVTESADVLGRAVLLWPR